MQSLNKWQPSLKLYPRKSFANVFFNFAYKLSQIKKNKYSDSWQPLSEIFVTVAF